MYTLTVLIRHAVVLVPSTDPHREAMSAGNVLVQRLNRVEKGGGNIMKQPNELW